MAEMSGQGSDVEQQLLEANPIIEAFGNAKTVRNNNSSRFGKWVEVNFDAQFHIIGAKIYNYLLEKSRIIVPGPGERNYHVFYQLAAGAVGDEKKKWRLGHPMDYRICSMGGTWEIDGVDDVEEFRLMRQAMNVLKFAPEEQENIFRTVAAVLHLGNVDFTQVGDKASVKDLRVVQVTADLLGADAKELESALISQRKQMGRESILTFRNQVQAEAGRDALAKAIYGHLFNGLIERINRTLLPKGKPHRIVGVLDIFGFEIFEVNRFEQFMIVSTNQLALSAASA
jgi:myosin heavy subunit